MEGGVDDAAVEVDKPLLCRTNCDGGPTRDEEKELPLLWYPESDGLTESAGGMGESSASMTTSEARDRSARGSVRMPVDAAACEPSELFWADVSSPSREPYKTNSASEQSDGQEPYGEAVLEAGGVGLIISPKLEEVMIYGRGRSVSSGVPFMSSVAGYPKDSRKDSRD